MHMKYILVNILIIHCLNNKMQNTENKTKYMYTERLQLLKKMHAAERNAVLVLCQEYEQTYFLYL